MSERQTAPDVSVPGDTDNDQWVLPATGELSRDQLAIILGRLTDGITIQNSSGDLIYANDAAAQISGYPNAQAMLGTPVVKITRQFEMFDESGRTLPVEELPGRQALRGVQGPPIVIRFRSVHASEERWALVTSRAVYSRAGHVDLVVNIFRDITELKRAELGQRLLAQVGTLLSASLNYETRLSNVAHLAVPDLADWCAIDVADADRTLRRLTVTHVDPARIELVHELVRRYPPHPDDPTGIYAVLRTGRPELHPDIPDSLLEATIQDAELSALVRQLGLKSAMIVPMVARGRTLGVITFAWAESGRHYDSNDLALAEELARRSALSMDNALLYAEAQQLNAELERRVAERTAQVQTANAHLLTEIAERRQAEEQVRLLNVELERRVTERTTQLETLNRDLNSEVGQRQQTSKALRAVLRRTRELYRLSQMIGTARTPDEVLQALLSASYLKAASRASIALFSVPWLDNEHPPQRCRVLAGWNKETDLPAFVDEWFTLEEYGFLPPYSGDKPVIIEDVRSTRALPEQVRRRFKTLKTRSLIIFPLIAGGEWYGLLSLHFRSRRAIHVDDLRHIRGLVDQAAIAVNNIRLLAAEAKARRAAEQANDLKLKFLAMISHELRTPLTSIKGFATTLLADDVEWHPASQRDFLQTINEEADKLGDLIEQLLDLSRLEAGVLRIAPRPQTLAGILSTAMAQLQIVTGEHYLVLEVPESLPPIHVDGQRIAQVLTNLVSNAAKYSPPQTAITITARLDDGVIQVDVADQGPGIPPLERARVFEAFQQVESEVAKRTGGAGLGLAICKGLVEAHGGQIWVQDRSKPGTVISFTLPISETAL